jgi:hypothetical protein
MACPFRYQPRRAKLQSEQHLSFQPEQLNKFPVALEQMQRVIVIQELQ